MASSVAVTLNLINGPRLHLHQRAKGSASAGTEYESICEMGLRMVARLTIGATPLQAGSRGAAVHFLQDSPRRCG
jgi:hypothetical protein